MVVSTGRSISEEVGAVGCGGVSAVAAGGVRGAEVVRAGEGVRAGGVRRCAATGTQKRETIIKTTARVTDRFCGLIFQYT